MITLDLETRSMADLKKVGAWAYSQDDSTDVICACWAIDDGPVHSWWPLHMLETDECGVEFSSTQSLFEAIEDGHEIEAHNVAFEKSLWQNVLTPRYGWPYPDDDKWRDTMAVAAYYAMPHGLDKLSQALGFPPKNPEGTRLISKYSKMNLKTAWGAKPLPPGDFTKFVNYCIDDVLLEQAVSDELGDLPDRELPYFLLDQKMNQRGLFLDLHGIETATEIVDQRAQTLTEEFLKLTGGIKPTQTAKLKEWFSDHGLFLANLQKAYLEDLIEEGEIPSGPARRALTIRLAINKASTKKLDAMARNRGSDGRAKFQSRYHGASTGRNTGTGFQPLNLSRGFDDMQPEQLVRDIMYADAEYLDLLYGSAMDAVGKASRYWIMAEPGYEIIAGDYVSVEAVVLACLADETWKIDAFRNGVKLYEHMADKIYNLPAGTVTKATHPAERQDGKTGELAFGYQGALGAWLKFDSSGRHSDERIIEICKAWRAEHPAIVSLWRDIEWAAIEALNRPDETIWLEQCAVGFEIVDDWLSMILPSGKRIWYYSPQLRSTMPQWHRPETKEDCRAGTCDCKPRAQLAYRAVKNGQWTWQRTYGGKLTENVTQATSRELLMPAAQRVEDAGYPVILTVYDEVVTEVPIGQGSATELEELMAVMPEWAADWPITVDAWAGERYRK